MGWKLCTLSTKPPDNGDGAIVVDWKQKLNQHNGKKLKSGIWTTKHNNVSGRFCFLACGTIISGSSATLACTCVHQQLTQSHSFEFVAGFILKHTLYCFAIAGQRWLWKRCIFHQANHWRLEKKLYLFCSWHFLPLPVERRLNVISDVVLPQLLLPVNIKIVTSPLSQCFP